DTPIPRFGGIALAGAFVVVSLVVCVWSSLQPLQNRTYVTTLLSALAMFGVGLWDDFRPLGARKKLLLQVFIASLVYWCGVQIQTFKNPLSGVEYSLGPWGFAATVFWLVAMTNLINLIDGIDGLAAGISLMLMGLMAYVGYDGLSFTFLVAVG